jgi:hypothetical protein
MKASEAYIRTQKAKTYQNTIYRKEVDKILEQIGAAADEGQLQISIDFVHDIPIKILRDEFGYEVSVYSERNETTTTISWKCG